MNNPLYTDVTTFNPTNYRYREENLMVYRYDTNTGAEILLYDFGLEVGDQIDLSNYEWSESEGIATVTERNIIDFAGQDRIRITFDVEIATASCLLNELFTEMWIEGIGSATGFNFEFNAEPDATIGFVCFSNNGITWYDCQNSESSSSCAFTTLSTTTNDIINLSIYPNPITNESIISGNSITKTFTILDVQGREIMKQKINASFFKTYRDYFQSSGVYFIRLESNIGRISTKKIIVN